MVDLVDSVGEGGRNHALDVLRVQSLLQSKGYNLQPGRGICSKDTIAALKKFQASFMAQPNGIVEPYSLSAKKLLEEGHVLYEWSGDSSQWTQGKKLKSLHQDLQPQIVSVIRKLKEKGFMPYIFYGWRSVAVQLALHASGRSKVKFSFHNGQRTDGTPNAYAADIIDSRFGWSLQAERSCFWNELGFAANNAGLIWGGDWSSFRDVAHVQMLPNSYLSFVKQESGL